MHGVWDQLALSEPEWSCIIDIEKFTTYRDGQCLILFLMTLKDDFEPVHASLLYQNPLPTLEDAISELLSEETRLRSLKNHQLHNILTTPQGRHSTTNSCSYCHSTNHNPNCQPHDARPRGGQHKSNNRYRSSAYSSSIAVVTAESSSTAEPSIAFSLQDLEAIVKQVLSTSGTPSTVLSITSGSTDGVNSWDQPKKWSPIRAHSSPHSYSESFSYSDRCIHYHFYGPFEEPASPGDPAPISSDTPVFFTTASPAAPTLAPLEHSTNSLPDTFLFYLSVNLLE
ncbi:hypothetical protein Acr_00g0016960 [Actinidia rufa]|uniref:Uncharacterized protein n=1 Tax=Actinidia rufa TaxID=165716 RepID=A0A7J0DB12_9ERIC|nr:hypothetical protein Acr_00g0016960 [Actinidia rufa]